MEHLKHKETKMRILITGGLGYLGCELVSLLQASPNITEISVYDKGVFGINHFASLMSTKTKLIVADILDRSYLEDAVKSVDIVIHLASLVGAPLVDRKPHEAHEVNIRGAELLSSLIANDQRIIFASTGSCYGRLEGLCDENSAISPLSSYGRHKAIGEEIFQKNNAVNLRFATVYGLSYRTRNDLYINNMMKKAVYDQSVVLYQGNAKRTFIHVRDAARAVELIALKSTLEHKTYNVGDKSLSLSKRDVCELIASETAFTIVADEFAKDPDQRDYVVDYTRIYDEGFVPTIKLKEQLGILKNYYLSILHAGYENG